MKMKIQQQNLENYEKFEKNLIIYYSNIYKLLIPEN